MSRKTILLPAGHLLTLTADALSFGTLTRLPNSAGGGEYSPIDIAVSTTPIFGAFSTHRKYALDGVGVSYAISPTLNNVDGDLAITGATTMTGNILTEQNVGTVGTGTTAVEIGNGNSHITTLTVAGVLPAITGGVDQATGLLLYTFPAGAIIVNHAYISMAVTQSAGNITADTPEVGLGTVIGTGAVAVLSTTFEDIITGQVAADCNGTATVKTAIPTAAVPFVIEAAAAHTIHFNVADGFAASGDAAATVAGTVVIDWSFVK